MHLLVGKMVLWGQVVGERGWITLCQEVDLELDDRWGSRGKGNSSGSVW